MPVHQMCNALDRLIQLAVCKVFQMNEKVNVDYLRMTQGLNFVHDIVYRLQIAFAEKYLREPLYICQMFAQCAWFLSI